MRTGIIVVVIFLLTVSIGSRNARSNLTDCTSLDGKSKPGIIAVDNFGDVHVVGKLAEANGLEDLVTIKYHPAGNLMWDKRFANSEEAWPTGRTIVVKQDAGKSRQAENSVDNNSSGSPAPSAAVPATTPSGAVSAYPSLNAAVTALAASGSITIDAPTTMSADLTIPSNMRVTFANTGSINLAGHNLTINGPFEAGRYQVFKGGGAVTLGSGAVEECYPQWWGAVGDGATESSSALQAWLNQPAGVKRLPKGIYLAGSTLTFPWRTNIQGDGSHRSIIKSTVSSGYAMQVDYSNPPTAEYNAADVFSYPHYSMTEGAVTFRDFGVHNTVATASGINAQDDCARFDNVWIMNEGGYYAGGPVSGSIGLKMSMDNANHPATSNVNSNYYGTYVHMQIEYYADGVQVGDADNSYGTNANTFLGGVVLDCTNGFHLVSGGGLTLDGTAVENDLYNGAPIGVYISDKGFGGLTLINGWYELHPADDKTAYGLKIDPGVDSPNITLIGSANGLSISGAPSSPLVKIGGAGTDGPACNNIMQTSNHGIIAGVSNSDEYYLMGGQGCSPLWAGVNPFIAIAGADAADSVAGAGNILMFIPSGKTFNVYPRNGNNDDWNGIFQVSGNGISVGGTWQFPTRIGRNSYWVSQTAPFSGMLMQRANNTPGNDTDGTPVGGRQPGIWQAPFYLGSYALWVSATSPNTGKLMIKNGVPSDDTDGTPVGQ